MSRRVKIIGLVVLGLLLLAGVVALLAVRAEQQRQAEEYVSQYNQALQDAREIGLVEFLNESDDRTEERIERTATLCTQALDIGESLPEGVPRLDSEQHDETEGRYALDDFRRDITQYGTVCEYMLLYNRHDHRVAAVQASDDYQAFLTDVNCDYSWCFDTAMKDEFADYYEAHLLKAARDNLAAHQETGCPLPGADGAEVCQAITDYAQAEVTYREVYLEGVRREAGLTDAAEDRYDDWVDTYEKMITVTSEFIDREVDGDTTFYSAILGRIEERFAVHAE